MSIASFRGETHVRYMTGRPNENPADQVPKPGLSVFFFRKRSPLCRIKYRHGDLVELLVCIGDETRDNDVT